MGYIGMHAYVHILFMREPNENNLTHVTASENPTEL